MDYPETISSAIQERKPSIYLDEKDLPEVKDWTMGGEYVIVLHVKQISAHLDPDGKVDACLEVQNAMVAPTRYTKSILESAKEGDSNGS